MKVFCLVLKNVCIHHLFNILYSHSCLTDLVSSLAKRHVEVAVTATAVPVLVNIRPSNMLMFDEIDCGEKQQQICSLVNESALLPLSVEFCKIAHFDVSPPIAKIKPGATKVNLLECLYCTCETLECIDYGSSSFE